MANIDQGVVSFCYTLGRVIPGRKTMVRLPFNSGSRHYLPAH